MTSATTHLSKIANVVISVADVVGVRNLADPIKVDSTQLTDPTAQLAVVLLALFGQTERTYTLERAAHARAGATASQVAGRRSQVAGRRSQVAASICHYAIHRRCFPARCVGGGARCSPAESGRSAMVMTRCGGTP